MPIQAEVKDQVRYVSLFDHVTPEDVKTYSDLTCGELTPGHVATFTDLSRLKRCMFGFQEMYAHTKRLREQREPAFLEVMLAPTDLGYGLSRMHQAIVDGAYRVEIFRDDEEARQFLKQALQGMGCDRLELL